MKILYVVGEGIGNQIQALPGLIYAKKKYKEVIVWNAIQHTAWVTDYIFGNFAEIWSNGEHDPPDGLLFTCPCWDIPTNDIPVFNAIDKKRNLRCSEVEYNLAVVDDQYTDNDFIVNFGVGPDITSWRVPDILLHNGYSKVSDYAKQRWEAKGYLYYEQLAKELKKQGYTVGSIGTNDEYIRGTVNHTGLSIAYTQSFIEQTKLLIANDTGTYHLANLVDTPNIVLFTFTDWRKSYDDRFHRQARIISAEYECQPCQFKDSRKDYWMENKHRCKWKCREIDVKAILAAVEEILG